MEPDNRPTRPDGAVFDGVEWVIPHEPYSWAEVPGWFCSLWPRLKGGLHDWLHKSLPDCPDCAEWRAKADARAMECQSLEAAADSLASKLRASRVLAQSEKARADEAEHRLGEVGNPGPSTEPPGPLTYAQFIASRELRPLVPFPESMKERVRGRVRTSVTAADQTVEMCHRWDGKPAITTAEITARAQEMVNAREAAP